MEKKTKSTTKKQTKKVVKKQTTKKETKSNSKKKKGFTLIELLAVIIILGILMIIAIPSVTSYINDSRKNAYIDTAKEVVSGTRNIVNEGRLGMYDTNTTYYIPAKYVNTENSLKSPYGEFTDTSAYVGVIYDGQGYKYYWISSDDAGQGIPNVTLADKLDTDDIVSDLKTENIRTTIENTGIGDRKTIKILKVDGTWESPIILSNTDNNVSEDGYTPPKITCKRANNLHTEICSNPNTSFYCGGGGNEINSVMTYGNTSTTDGVLNPGDAFDCDVDGTGYNHRFYYISDYYDTSTKTINDKVAVLLYYTNTISGEPSTLNSAFASKEDCRQIGPCNQYTCNWYGPVSAIKNLPTTEQWSNIKLYKEKRALLADDNTSVTRGGTLPSDFSYEGYAARLLTYQEIKAAYGNNLRNEDSLINYKYLMEKTIYANENYETRGFWLETSYYFNTISFMYVNASMHYVSEGNTIYYGVRPAIEILKSEISY